MAAVLLVRRRTTVDGLEVFMRRSLIAALSTMSTMSTMSTVLTVLSIAAPAHAEKLEPRVTLLMSAARPDIWHRVRWLPDREDAAARLLTFASASGRQDAQPLHAAAIQHSDAYQTRAKIHKYASFATLPLFATELVLGQSLYNSPSSVGAKRGAHIAVGTALLGLFGLDTVTGAWNLFGEGWSEPQGRTLRLVHGLLMMAAEAGFVATAATGPNSGSRRAAQTFDSDKATHRNIAVASISVGTAGYVLMLFGNN
jgi:hypothetical protein